MKHENLLYIDGTNHCSYHEICMRAIVRAKIRKVWIIFEKILSTNFTEYILFVKWILDK